MSAEKVWSYCSLCNAPLDADNCYGEDDFPLCREHHGLFYDAVNQLVKWSEPKMVNPVKPMQLGLGI